MRRLMILAALAGCSTVAPLPQPPEPSRVILYRDTVTVEMRDGALCTGVRRGAARGWSGTLGGCPHPLPFRVERSVIPVRMVLSEGLQPAPHAIVTIETSSGPLTYSG